jgi:hypothetical protein
VEPPVVDWVAGSRSVTWTYGGSTVAKEFDHALDSVVAWSDPPSVIVVEPTGLAGRVDNAVVYNADGSERLRLVPPDVGEPRWRVGFYFVFVSSGVLTAVFSTTVGDFWGVPDLQTGVLANVNTWR